MATKSKDVEDRRLISKLSAALVNSCNIKELISFATVGLSATLTHASVGFLVAAHFDISGAYANVIGFICAWWISFLGHFHFSFQDHGQGWAAFWRFTLHSILIFGAAHSLTLLASHLHLHDSRVVPVIGSLMTPMVSFFAYKFFVFKKIGGVR